jgi:hypothetical protein
MDLNGMLVALPAPRITHSFPPIWLVIIHSTTLHSACQPLTGADLIVGDSRAKAKYEAREACLRLDQKTASTLFPWTSYPSVA